MDNILPSWVPWIDDNGNVISKTRLGTNHRRRRQLRKYLGLCERCDRPLVSNALCAVHLEIYELKYNPVKIKRRAALTAERKIRRECVRCGLPTVPGATTCEPHRDMLRMRAMQRYHLRKMAGICGHCADKVSPGRTLCPRHLVVAVARYHQRKKSAGAAMARKKIIECVAKMKKLGISPSVI